MRKISPGENSKHSLAILSYQLSEVVVISCVVLIAVVISTVGSWVVICWVVVVVVVVGGSVVGIGTVKNLSHEHI